MSSTFPCETYGHRSCLWNYRCLGIFLAPTERSMSHGKLDRAKTFSLHTCSPSVRNRGCFGASRRQGEAYLWMSFHAPILIPCEVTLTPPQAALMARGRYTTCLRRPVRERVGQGALWGDVLLALPVSWQLQPVQWDLSRGSCPTPVG